METRNINQLRPHPENEKIYGAALPDDELIQSIQDRGIRNPLLITKDNMLIGGHRRWAAAKRIGLAEVPVNVFHSDDPSEILFAMLDDNTYRDNKSNEVKGREYDLRKRLYHEQLSRQGERTDVNGTSNKILLEVQAPNVQAAKSVGLSQPTADRAAAVVRVIDNLETGGKQREASILRSSLNKSVSTAYNNAREAGHIQTTERKPANEPKATNIFTVPEWGDLSEVQRKTVIVSASGSGKFNDQKNDNIEWAMWSWNPVTGCKHNCPYCYARDIAMRYRDIYPHGFEPAFLPDRLTMPMNTKVPAEALTNIGYKNVFTCSMADLFGKWVPREWITAVLDSAAKNPQWNFLFLTKFPIRMAEFDFPDNAWVGTTVDCQARVKNAEQAFRQVNAKVKWLSCEPLLEPLHFSDLSMFQWLVIGGSSKSTQTPEWRPPRAWVNALEDQSHAAGCMVYEKTNLLERAREYPTSTVALVQLPDALRYLPSIAE